LRLYETVNKQTHSGSRLWRIVLIATVVCLSLASLTRSEEPSHLLDGMSFVGKNGEVGKDLAEYEDEVIVFETGIFTSVSCEPYSFSSSPYQARVVGDKIYFEVVTKSPTHGQISWTGVVDGDEVDVKFVWTKERWYWDIRREYWFKGKLKE